VFGNHVGIVALIDCSPDPATGECHRIWFTVAKLQPWVRMSREVNFSQNL